MLQKARQWFAPPLFPEDEDKTRRAWVLSALLTSVLIIAIPVMLAIIFVLVQKIGVSVLMFLLISLVAVSYGLLKRGWVDAASRTYVVGMWLLFTLLYILAGRTNSAASNLLIPVIVTAGILLGRKGALIFAALSGLVILVIAVLETNGYPFLVLFPGPPLSSWVAWIISVFLTLQPLNLTIQRIIRSSEILRESEERLNFVLEGSQLGYWDWDIKTGKVQRNSTWAEMLGYSLEEIESNVHQWTDLHHPDDRERTWKSINDHLQGRTPNHKMEYRMKTKSGEYKWILDQAKIVEWDEQGQPLRMSGTHTDITDRKRVEESEHEQRSLAEALIDNAAVLNSTLNSDEVLDRIMENVEHVLPHDSVGLILLDESRRFAILTRYHDNRVEKSDRSNLSFDVSEARNLREMQKTGEPIIVHDTLTYDGWVQTPSGMWIRSVLGVPIKIKNEVIGFLSLSRAQPNAYTDKDANRLKAFVDYAGIAIENARLYEELQRLALTDTLTGIYNRTFFEAELVRLEDSRELPVSIIVIDLDNMKKINDKFGHLAGDNLLKAAVQILQEVFRKEEIIARIGGDEFAILLPKTDERALGEILPRIRSKLQEYNSKHADLPVLMSIGASTTHQGNLIEGFKLADNRMYAEKAIHHQSGE